MSEPSFRCTLKCWTCGDEKKILTNGPAQFAFEVAGWMEKAKTKKGIFRLRPPPRAKEVSHVG